MGECILTGWPRSKELDATVGGTSMPEQVRVFPLLEIRAHRRPRRHDGGDGPHQLIEGGALRVGWSLRQATPARGLLGSLALGRTQPSPVEPSASPTWAAAAQAVRHHPRRHMWHGLRAAAGCPWRAAPRYRIRPADLPHVWPPLRTWAGHAAGPSKAASAVVSSPGSGLAPGTSLPAPAAAGRPLPAPPPRRSPVPGGSRAPKGSRGWCGAAGPHP